MGFSAQETAEQLATSVPSVMSALQRARIATQARAPPQSQHSTLRSVGDERVKKLVTAYVGALERGDAPALVALLTEEATWAMPPLPTWYRGREAIKEFLEGYGFNERWRHLPTTANGQLAFGCYSLEPESGLFVPSALQVPRLDGEQVAEVDYVVTAELLRRWGSEGSFVGTEAFPRFGLPAVLP